MSFVRGHQHESGERLGTGGTNLYKLGMYACIPLLIGVLVSTARGAIPQDIGVGALIVLMCCFTVLRIMGVMEERKADRKRYRAAGFEVDAMAGVTYRWAHRKFSARDPFPGVVGLRYLLVCCYWLPDAPHIRVFDCDVKGNTVGHIIERPTSAPTGVAGIGLSEHSLESWAGKRGSLKTLPAGVLCSETAEEDGLTRWLPLHPGILVVEDGYARWFSLYPLDIAEIRRVVEQLKMMPK